MRITDFAEKQTHYTGASNKVKWVITNPEILLQYLKDCNLKPAILAKKLNTSYATVKRFLCASKLWEFADVKKQNYKSGKKRTVTHDKFGYKFAEDKYDYKNERGEIIRRYQHHVIAEQKLGRPLKDKEVIHHIDLDKTNNSPENIYVCRDNKEHRLIHGQLEREAGKAVREGLIKFDPEHGYYINPKIGIPND